MQATQKLCIAGLILTAAPGLLAQQDWLNSFTPDGQPDLQGVWTNPTITPMERPASLADRAYLSDDEVAALEARTAQRRQEADANIEVSDGGDVGAYNQIWLDSGDTVLSTGQTSLVVDPPTGRAPIRESAQQTRDYFFVFL